MSALISIIVPVYKTEPYLRKCLESIVSQTYKNMEIILVNDGSPDNCGEICDKYASIDSRIKVIHQKNGGLSAARNAGLRIASGEYIGFVDSDDWIENDMFETLYLGALKYGADIAICGYFYEDCAKYKEVKEEHTVLLDCKDALHHLILDKTFTNHVWNKLFKNKLFEGVYFPEGRIFEDIATTYKLFEKTDKVVYLNSCKYYYRQREDSIVGSGTMHGAADKCIMMCNRYMDLMEKYPEEKDIFLAGFYAALADFGYVVSKQRENYFRAYKNDLGQLIDFAIKNKRAVWKCSFIGRARKLNYMLFLQGGRLAFVGIRFFVLISKLKKILSSVYKPDNNSN